MANIKLVLGIGIPVAIFFIVLGVLFGTGVIGGKQVNAVATTGSTSGTKTSGANTKTSGATSGSTSGATSGSTSGATSGATKSEVYYYDNAGNNEGRYKLTLESAKALATKLGGTIATEDQIREAHKAGLDVCSIGWASDGMKYISSVSDRGPASGCTTSGVQKGTWGTGAGVFVYGPKPAKPSGDCSTYPSTPCAAPFSPSKWSQYS